MRGVYCLLIEMREACSIRVGKLGSFDFPAGVYVYVGSALAGVQQRVRRHRSSDKRRRWHIDYLLAHAEIVSTMSVACDSQEYECAIAETLMHAEGAVVVVQGFGSSDCRCRSHLIYFGDAGVESVAELVSMRLSMLSCVHPRTVA